MEDYLKRGGGLISIHDTLCGDDPQYYSSIVGGSKLHGERNFSSGSIKYTIVDKASPIMKGMSDFADRRRGVLQDHVGEVARGPCPRHGADAVVRGSRAADVDLRADDLRRPAVPGIRVDAGTHLHELQESRRSRGCSCAPSPGRATIRSRRSSMARRPPVPVAAAGAVRVARMRLPPLAAAAAGSDRHASRTGRRITKYPDWTHTAGSSAALAGRSFGDRHIQHSI